MLKKINRYKYIYLGLLGWVLLTIFSASEYAKIIKNSCYFCVSWPFCTYSITTTKHIIQGLILLPTFLFFFFYGKYIFNYLKSNQETLNKKAYLLIIFFIICAFLIAPFGSGDTIYYFNAGKAVENGINPYTESWSIANYFFSPNNTMTIGVMYGPIILFGFKVIYKISLGNPLIFIILWKLLMILALIIAGFLIFKLIKIYSPDSDKRIFYFFWLTQPLILFEWIVNGHFDALWLIPILLAFIFSHKKQWWLTIIFLTISIWIKFIPLLITPWFILWWWQDLNKNNYSKKSMEAILGISISTLITYFAWLPFWQGMKVFQPLILQSKWAVFSIFSTAYYTLQPSFNSLLTNQSHWILTRLIHLSLLIVAIYFAYPLFKKAFLVLFKKIPLKESDYILAIFISLLIYLFIWQKSFWPWYITWIIPLGLIVYNHKKNIYLEKILIWLSLSPLFFYAIQMLTSTKTHQLWIFYYVVITIMAYPLWQLIKWRKNNYDIS